MLVTNCTLWSSKKYTKQNLILAKKKILQLEQKVSLSLPHAKAIKLFLRSQGGFCHKGMHFLIAKVTTSIKSWWLTRPTSNLC